MRMVLHQDNDASVLSRDQILKLLYISGKFSATEKTGSSLALQLDDVIVFSKVNHSSVYCEQL